MMGYFEATATSRTNWIERDHGVNSYVQLLFKQYSKHKWQYKLVDKLTLINPEFWELCLERPFSQDELQCNMAIYKNRTFGEFLIVVWFQHKLAQPKGLK